MITPIETILGGIVVAVMSGVAGKILGSRGRMTEEHCDEKQKGCKQLLGTKIDNVDKRVEKLDKKMDALTTTVTTKLIK